MSDRNNRDAEIVRRFDGGEKQISIAKAFGLTRQRIQQLLDQNGRSQRQPPRVSNPTLRQQVIELRESGLTPAEITRRLSISRNQTLGILYRAGLCAKSEAA